MVRNILIAILLITLALLYYQNDQMNSYIKVIEVKNQQLNTRIERLALKEKAQMNLEYLSPLYMHTDFYSDLPYKYQWFLQGQYKHIDPYEDPVKESWIDYYNVMDYVPEVNYDKEKDDLSIKFQLKKEF